MGDGDERAALWSLTHQYVSAGSVEDVRALQTRLDACLAERDALRGDLNRALAERDAVAQDRETLASVAWKCRTAQRRYFQRRDQETMVLAKRWEARLDQQLARFTQPDAEA
jgi:hypothetical protein